MEAFTPPFTADDIEGGYTAVTPKLYIGKPPFEAYGVRSAVEGAWHIRARNAVVVQNSDEARAVLVELGVTDEEIETLLHAARYGLLATYPSPLM